MIMNAFHAHTQLSHNNIQIAHLYRNEEKRRTETPTTWAHEADE